ncbi:seryl-trna synthetase, partial [Lasius niger]
MANENETLELEKLKERREIILAKVNELISEVRNLVLKEELNDDEKEQLQCLENNIHRKENEISKVTTTIQDMIPVGELKQDMDKMDQFQEK